MVKYMNIETSSKPKKLIINRDGLKVIRLTLTQGESIPEHSTNADLVIVVVKGEGIFYINNNPKSIAQGDVLDLAPEVPHAISATSNLELIVTHMHLKLNHADISCGACVCAQ